MTAGVAISLLLHLAAAVLLGWLLAPRPLRRRAPLRHLGFALLWIGGGSALWTAFVVLGVATTSEAFFLTLPLVVLLAAFAARPVFGAAGRGRRGLAVAGLQFTGGAAATAIETAWLSLRPVQSIPALEG